MLNSSTLSTAYPKRGNCRPRSNKETLDAQNSLPPQKCSFHSSISTMDEFLEDSAALFGESSVVEDDGIIYYGPLILTVAQKVSNLRSDKC